MSSVDFKIWFDNIVAYKTRGTGMDFKQFEGTEQACDNIYDNPDYENTFFVETKNGERVKVALTWEQGLGNNYRFIRGGDTITYNSRDIIWPNEIEKIEKRV